MKVAGIVAEYNPFHNGHKYQIEQTRALTGADYIIVVMSGNFTQRGHPSLIDKYARAHMALENGADLVIELPSCYACASAEYFALGATTLLNKLGIVDSMCFGSESGDITSLSSIAQIFAFEPIQYQRTLKARLKKGDSFPVARNAALTDVYPEFIENTKIVSSPNNILGIEYIKALLRSDSSITPYTHQRKGSSYHDYKLSVSFSSALSLRQAIEQTNELQSVKGQVPDSSYEIMERVFSEDSPIFADDFSYILKYKLLMEEHNGYNKFTDISSELSNKIKKTLYTANSFTDFCTNLKSRNLTYTRVSRCLNHILLDFRKEHLSEYLDEGTIFYARVLGFKKDSKQLFTSLASNSSIPLITKVSQAHSLLQGTGIHQFEKDIEVSHIYESVLSSKSNRPMKNEYMREIIKKD